MDLLSQPVFYLLVIIAFLTSIIYLRGSKKNKKLAKIISTELENALKPQKQEYINIGGFIGYHGNYVRPGYFYKVNTTFTFIPRHSIMFLPVSLLTTKHDKLYVTIHSKVALKGEAHLILEKLNKSSNHKVKNVNGKMKEERIEINNVPYLMYYENLDSKQFIEKCINQLDMKYIYHITSYEPNRNFYLYMNPKPGHIENNVRKFIQLCKDQIIKDKKELSK